MIRFPHLAGRKAHLRQPWLILTAIIPVVLVALPLSYLFIRTAQLGAQGAWDELFRLRNIELLSNTLLLVFGVTFCSVLLGLSVAWTLERTNLAGRRYLKVMAGLPLVVPAFVASYAWASIDIAFQSMWGAILILSLSKYPLVYLPVAASLRNADPAFEDVARSLGCRPWKAFATALLPQLIPAVGGGALLVATHMLAEFGALALLGVQTFTTAIFESYELQFSSATAAMQSLVLIALSAPLIWAEIRLRGKKQVARVGKGSARTARLVILGHYQWIIWSAFILLLMLGLGVPFIMLGYWLITGASLGLGYEYLLPAIQGTLTLAASGAFTTSLIAIPLVLLAVRHRGKLALWAERLPYIVHGLPGVVVALALVFLTIRLIPWAYQTLAVVLIAYAILFLPLAQSSLRASIELLPNQLENVGRSLGKSPFYVFITVILPNIAPGIGAALALMMLEMARELTATLMLAPTGTVTLATQVWKHTSDGEFAAAAPFAALLVVISILPVWVFTHRMLKAGN